MTLQGYTHQNFALKKPTHQVVDGNIPSQNDNKTTQNEKCIRSGKDYEIISMYGR